MFLADVEDVEGGCECAKLVERKQGPSRQQLLECRPGVVK